MENENIISTARAEELDMTPEERERILSGLLISREPLRLKAYPAKYKRKLAVLSLLAEGFETGRTYTQAEVNDILGSAWDDPVTLRRDMIELGLLCRTQDGRSYWKK